MICYKNTSLAIKSLRINRGMSAKTVFEKLGMSKSAYSSIEKGTQLPSMFQIMDMCSFFRVNVDYFIFMIYMDYCECSRKKEEAFLNMYVNTNVFDEKTLEVYKRYARLPDFYKRAVDDFICAAEDCVSSEL